MYKNDVVLIELDSPVILGRNVSAICLPEQDIEARQLCVVAGWGVNKPGGKSFLFLFYFNSLNRINKQKITRLIYNNAHA